MTWRAAMAETNQQSLPTKADVAKAVKRTVIRPVLDSKKNPVADDKGMIKTETVKVDVAESEVLSYRVDGSRVVVVTTDGQKLTGTLAA